ncbi:hypothetical protein IFR05_008464 [Cadophora sp. M221]|nr:hypothetical protein IFR05_008464 [Cadophora sp. M221]
MAYTTEPEILEGTASNEAGEDMVQNSKANLNSRLKEFLKDAKPSVQRSVETSRGKVLQVLQEASSAHYERYSKREPGSDQKLAEKVKDGLRFASETAFEYVKILDVMVSQAPEYVALAYGAVQILLVVQVNYEEMKQNVENYMGTIKSRFELIDYLTAYLPTERLVGAIAKMYDFLNRFLAKALKFYTRSRIRLTFNSIAKPWKQLEPLVLSIEHTYLEVKDIVMFHGHLTG